MDFLKEAKRVLNDTMEQAEMEQQELRLKSPFILTPGANPLARLDSIEAKRTELNLKEIELNSRLSSLKPTLVNDGAAPENQERRSRVVLLKLQNQGIDVAKLRKAITGDGTGNSATEFLRTYFAAVNSELDELKNTLRSLDDLREVEMKMLRERMKFEMQDEHLRNRIIRTRQLWDAMVKKLTEFSLIQSPSK